MINSKKKKVAIILCVKNSNNFLLEQLESIKNQRSINYDLFIGNDGCSPLIEIILKKYSKEIFLGAKEGFGKNFICTLKKVPNTYDYYAFCDHDDVWVENKLEHALTILENFDNKKPSLYCGRTMLINENGKEIGFSPLFKKEPSFLNALVQSIAGGNTMIFNGATKNLLAKINLKKPIISHDWLTYLFVSAMEGNIFYDEVPTVRYRIHQNNKIGSNLGLFAFLKRAIKVFNCSWKTWIDANLSQISEIMPLAKTNDAVFEAFLQLRDEKNYFKKINLFRSIGIYRQTLIGNVALFVMVIFNKI